MAESKDYRQILTDKLIEQLEAGTAPWQKPWDAKAGIPRLPYNPTTGKEYRGANSLYLAMQGRDDPRWATFKQANGQGWQVRKGEKGTLVEYWKMSDEVPAVDDQGKPILDENGKQKTQHVTLERPQVFRAVVFNAQQMDNVPELEVGARQYEWDPIERAEQIIGSSGARIYHDQTDRAYYIPSRDEIHLPGKDQFPDQAAYYATALHELGHWTGHESRLGRDLTGGFGSPDYAKEELRAELSSYFMADKLGIQHDPGQHAAYVKSWIKVLKEDKNEIFRAAKDAEKITDYVLQLDQEREKELGQGRDAVNAGVENDAIGTALREVAAGKEQPGDLPSEARVRLDEATEKAFAATLPVGWNGNVRIVGVIEVETNGEKHIEPATTIPGAQPQFYGVYGQLEEGGHEWIADRADLAAAKQLASRITSIHELALPNPDHKPEVTVMVPPEPEKILASERTALVVPFKEKEAAKALGAKWDKDAKEWYVPPGTDLAPLGKWMPAPAGELKPELPAQASPAMDQAREAPAKAAHEMTLSEFVKGAGAEKLTMHGRDWHVYLGDKDKGGFKDLGFQDGDTAEMAIRAAHSREVNNALWGNSKDAPWASDPEHTAMGKKPTMPPPEVLAEYPQLVEKFAEVVQEHATTPAPAQEKTWLAVPFKEKGLAREAGAKWDKEAKAWYAPPGSDMEKLSQWVPKNEVSQSVGLAPALDPVVEFGKAIRAAGLELDGDPEMDGKLHRVPLADGKKGNRDGAYVGYLDGRPAGSIQNWVSGEKQNWKLEGPEMTAEQRAELAAQSAINKQDRAAKLSIQHDDAAAKAQTRWDRATDIPADGATPYIERKQVPAVGLRRDGDNTLIPVRDIDGKLWAIQTVFPEKKELVPGTDPLDKVFTKDAKKEGNFHLLGEIQPGQPVITMEGYATGASVHKATGYAVAVAFDSGNLDAVVGALKERYPTNPHFIGADDDRFAKPGKEVNNAGLNKAMAAAEKHSVGVIVPAFATDGRFTDFNDLHVSEGLATVKQQIEAGVSQSMEQSRVLAESIARARLGEGAEVKQPGPDTRHTGKVLDVSGYHATQATSTKVATVHQVQDLDKLPVPGQTATIQYQGGRGKVAGKAVEKEKDLQR